MNTIETDTDHYLADVLARLDQQSDSTDTNADERADDPCAEDGCGDD